MVGTVMRVSATAHEVAELTVQSVMSFPYAVRRHKLLFKQLYEVGNRGLLIVSLMGGFIGMILALQIGYQLRRFNLEQEMGLMGLAIIKEFGPVMTAFIIAGRIGSSYAAEIGTMKVYEEVDAITVMGVNPVAYLASPRLLACLVMLPVLTVYADFVGLMGGALVARTFVGVEFSRFFTVFLQNASMTEVWRSLVKCVVFGGIIAVTGCFFGFRTKGGAEGVGRSTTDSVVCGLLAVLIADYFMERVLLAL